MWHKLLIVLASACPINPLFPVPPEYIGPKTRATLTCIIDWHIKNNLDEFSALAKSVWGIYTPFKNLEGFIHELNKVQIIKNENEQSYKLDFMPAFRISGLRRIFKPKKFKCKANNRKYGKIKVSYDMKFPSELDFSKVQSILNGCIFRIPPNMYESIKESQVPSQVYNELSTFVISTIIILSIALSVIHKCIGKKRVPEFSNYTEFESALYLIIPFIAVALYERALYIVLFIESFLLFLYFKNNRNDFNWPLTDKQLYKRQALSPDGSFDFVTLSRVTLFIPVYLSIIGVDFITFSPLYFKSVHEGMCLMDVANGVFVITYAMVSPISNKHKNNITDFKTLFKMVFKKSFYLILLGVLRTAMTKFTNYKVPVREYGVFGNFFIVFGIVLLFSEIIIYLATPKACFGIAFFYTLIYEGLIYKYQLEKLVNNNPRNTFLLMNLESFLNIAGSIPLYLFAHILRYNLIVFDEKHKESLNSTSDAVPQNKPEKSKFMKLFSKPIVVASTESKNLDDGTNYGSLKISTLFFLFFFTMGLYYLLGLAGLNSVRTMSNLRYNLFVLSLSGFIFLISNLFIIYFEPYEANQTILMLNKNTLATFIFANLLTGLINLTIQPKLMPLYITAFIFIFYSLLVIGFAFIYNLRKDGKFKLVVPEFNYETINYQHIELSQLNANNLSNQGVSAPISSSRDGRMNLLREKLDILRTRVGRMSNTDIPQKE